MAFEGSKEKFGILAELWAFMRVRKKWWLGPIVLMLALLGLSSLGELVDQVVPSSIRWDKPLDIGEARSETDALAQLRRATPHRLATARRPRIDRPRTSRPRTDRAFPAPAFRPPTRINPGKGKGTSSDARARSPR